MPRRYGFLAALVFLFVSLSAPGTLEAQLVAGCPVDELPDLGGVEVLLPEEEIFLDEFGQALERFEGTSLEEFRAEFAPRKRYLEPSTATFVRGDANRDDSVDVSDAVSLLNWLFAGTAAAPGCLAAANVNDDSTVDFTDAIYLLTHIFLGGPAPRAPFPGCGASELPADEQVGCESPQQSCRT